MPEGFTFVKQLDCRKKYELGFSYRIEIISVIQDSEGNVYLREYRNSCDSGANGRPCTYIWDVCYLIGPEYNLSRINAGNWRDFLTWEQRVKPTIVFENTGGTYVDQQALDFAKE